MMEKIIPVKGSLTKVYQRCGHKNCKKCLSGEKHMSYLFIYRKDGKTCSKYVPLKAVDDLQKMIDLGAETEKNMVQNGIDFLDSLKRKPASSETKK